MAILSALAESDSFKDALFVTSYRNGGRGPGRDPEWMGRWRGAVPLPQHSEREQSGAFAVLT